VIPSSFIQVEPLVSYNYRTDSFATWHQQHPEITWLASETKAYNENRSDHFEDISYLDNSWMEMETFIAGQFIWSGIDYLGESGGWPYTTFNQGLLKTNAEIKPSAYYTQSIYSDKPMVKIVVVSKELADSLNRETNKLKKWAGAPVVRHWNFDEGEMLQVLLYTNCQEVEIELNDSTLVTLDKKSFDDGVIKTRVGYLAGKIHARAWYTDKAGTRTMVEDSILTAGKPAMILLQPDKTQMIADGSDVVHIRTSVTDTAGTTYPTADHMINYTVEGPGKIRVIDNGNPSDSTPYGSLQKRVFNGTQLVVIQSTLQPGDLTISASAAGLQPARLKVQSIQNDKK